MIKPEQIVLGDGSPGWSYSDPGKELRVWGGLGGISWSVRYTAPVTCDGSLSRARVIIDTDFVADLQFVTKEEVCTVIAACLSTMLRPPREFY